MGASARAGVPRQQFAYGPPQAATPYNAVRPSLELAAANPPGEVVLTQRRSTSEGVPAPEVIEKGLVVTSSNTASPKRERTGEAGPPLQMTSEPQVTAEGETSADQATDSGDGNVLQASGTGGKVIVQTPAGQGGPVPEENPPLAQTPPLPERVADASPRPTFPRAEPTTTRRSYVDLSAAPCFSHAPDYSWLVGQVEHSRAAREWRLRYASVDEADRFGGRVVLIENQHVGYLADGQYVQVRGHLVNTDRSEDARYRIESFEVIHDPNAAQPTPAEK
jgi:hypothetical protein